MAVTEVSICNLALSRIGMRVNLITALSDNSREAQLCQTNYAIVRDSLLEEGGGAWLFAKKRFALANQTTLSNQPWLYSYSVPTDMILPLYIEDSTELRLVKEPIGWTMQTSALNAKQILTSQASAVLIYIASITDPALFSYEFIDTLTWKLAWTLASSVAAPPDVQASLFKGYQYQLQVARAAGFNTGQPFTLPVPSQIATER